MVLFKSRAPRRWRTALVVIVAFAMLTIGAAARAQVLSNIATMEIETNQGLVTIQSNRDEILLAAASIPDPTITLQRVATVADGEPTPLDPLMCTAAGALPTPVAAPPSQSIALVHDNHARRAEPVYVVVEDQTRNTDAALREAVIVEVTAQNGDRERIVLRETAIKSGIFAGMLPPEMDADPTADDCHISLRRAEIITATYVDEQQREHHDIALVDPFGVVFDSRTGAPIDGARVHLVHDNSGQPATVYGHDGVSVYPSSATTGSSNADASGEVYPVTWGEYVFPITAPGRYRLVVEAPPGYAGPSSAAPSAFTGFVSPLGGAYVIADGSYGRSFVVEGVVDLQIDIPLDPAFIETPDGDALAIDIRVSKEIVEIGGYVRFEAPVHNRGAVTSPSTRGIITLPAGLVYTPATARIDGVAVTPMWSPVDRTLIFAIGDLPAQGEATISFVAQVIGGADREVVTHAMAHSGHGGISNDASDAVRIRAAFSDAGTIIGRVTKGVCEDGRADLVGVAGVRILMENGAYVLTDRDGLYHIEGVRPGLHVVRLDLGPHKDRFEIVACDRNTREAGRPGSRFVELGANSLHRVDFRLRRIGDTPQADAPTAADGAIVAPYNADIAWISPSVDFNPQGPAMTATVRTYRGQNVALFVNGALINPLAYDGTRPDEANALRVVHTWRGVPLNEGRNLVEARVTEAGGALVAQLSREVSYANRPAHATLVEERSVLIADGAGHPVIAVRLTDVHGNPVRRGVMGAYRVADPYTAAQETMAQQERQLSGLDRFETTYRVSGDDGVALITLDPTTASGMASIAFDFPSETNGAPRTETVEAWLEARREDWVVVGFARGSAGYDAIANHMEPLGDDDIDGQVSFYASGRVRGDWILTMAYDSDGPAQPDQSVLQTIDPDQYYTVYGDGSRPGFDAASARKLYLRLERPHFVAQFGDFRTNLTQAELARYDRALTGASVSYHGDRASIDAYIADVASRAAREEFQGDGLSGPYWINRTDIITNSESVRIETRDRYRSEQILAARMLTRHTDYDIDYNDGSLRFREPIQSRDFDGNPNFIVVEYETFAEATRHLNAGGRAVMTFADDRVELGVSMIRDAREEDETDLGGVDLRVAVTENTELRAEIAASRRIATSGEELGDEAALVEVEHRSGDLNMVASYRTVGEAFGVRQQNMGETGANKASVEARYRLAEHWAVTASARHETWERLHSERAYGAVTIEHRTDTKSHRFGVQAVRDHTLGREDAESRLFNVGASRFLMNRRLELSADVAVPLSEAESQDYPGRVRLAGAFQVNETVRLIGAHEITDGARYSGSLTRIGFELEPWGGARLSSSLNQQEISELGARTFAQYGLSQSLPLGEHWTVDAAVESVTALAGDLHIEDAVDANHPAAPGGFLGQNAINETFDAVSVGATYRDTDWSWTNGVEWRDGEVTDRIQFNTAALRQLSEGTTIAAAARREEQTQSAGQSTLTEAEVSFALRPVEQRWSFLDRLRMRAEQGDAGIVSRRGPVTGDETTRVVNIAALNYDGGADDGTWPSRIEGSVFYGVKYVEERIEDIELDGVTQMAGAEIRYDVTERIDVGFQSAALFVGDFAEASFVYGPSIGVTPVDNVWISVGYNFAGVDDRDFGRERNLAQGPYVAFRLKFDEGTFGGLSDLARGML